MALRHIIDIIIAVLASGPFVYNDPDSRQQQVVQDFCNCTCQCALQEGPCTCGLNNFEEELHPRVRPISNVMRGHLLRLQRLCWLSSSSMDEFVRLLNVREKLLKSSESHSLRSLYLDTTFCSYIHPLAHTAVPSSASDASTIKTMMTPSRLLNNTGCSRCCMDQDRIILSTLIATIGCASCLAW